MVKKVIRIIVITLVILGIILAWRGIKTLINQNRILQQVIKRLEADSRIAEVLVTDVHYDEQKARAFTTIKFLEYDAKNQPLKPRYFTFSGNIIQFQALVIRFDDFHIRMGTPLKDKSAYIFWKVFMLDGANTQEFEITPMNQVPRGYQIAEAALPFEKRLWENFWAYALNAQEAKKRGIKNAQIEAPGTMFIPGTLYTIKIEHHGGIRIDTQALPAILRGERIPDKW